MHDVLSSTINESEEELLDDVPLFIILHALITHLQVVIILQKSAQNRRGHLEHLKVLEIDIVIVEPFIIIDIVNRAHQLFSHAQVVSIAHIDKISALFVEKQGGKPFQMLHVTRKIALKIFRIDEPDAVAQCGRDTRVDVQVASKYIAVPNINKNPVRRIGRDALQSFYRHLVRQ